MKAIYFLLKMNRLVGSLRIKIAGVLAADILKLRHLFVRIDPVLACNLRCEMCYYSDKAVRQSKRGQFSTEEIARIGGLFFKRTLQLQIGCAAEPLMCKDLGFVLELAHRSRVPFVGLATNGQLMTPQHVSDFLRFGVKEITFSLHGTTRQTYERFMVGASFETCHEKLSMLAQAKREAKSQLPAIRFNYVVNPDNLDELPELLPVFGKYDPDVIQVRPIFDLEHNKYRNYDLQSSSEKYSAILKNLAEECRVSGITLLSSQMLPKPDEKNNQSSALFSTVVRYISPQVVWRSDFDWKGESYDEYCKRIHWKAALAKGVLKPESLAQEGEGDNSLGYEVSL